MIAPSSVIGSAVGSAFDGMMREIWTGSLELLRAVLSLVGELGTLDVTPGAGAISNELWSTMLGLAAVVAALLFFAQLAMAALNPRRHIFQAATGPVQYGIALALSVALVAGLLAAADGLTSLILQSGANVVDIASSMDQMGLVDDNNAVKAGVLGVLSVVGVIPLAIGYGITLLFRSAAILVLVATLPIAAAGLTNLATKTWFWRVSRWLLALIFLKPAFALCFALGSGIVAASGRTAEPGVAGVAGPEDGSGIVTLLLGLGIMFVALFAPYALFRLFAFIEPGTQPHQAMMSAFSSGVAGLRSTVSGVATADVGSVFSGATGGRFSGGDTPGGGSALGGLMPAGGSGAQGARQQAAMVGMAAATGGAGAAAGGAAAAGSGAGGAVGGGASAGGAAAKSADGAGRAGRPLAAAAASGAGDGGSAPGEADQVDADGEAVAGAPAARGSGGSGAGNGSSGSGSSTEGGWSVASAVSGAVTRAGQVGSGRVGAAAQALGSAAGGVASSSAAIGGSAPAPPSPMGGAVGSVGSEGLADYSGGYLGARTPRPVVARRAAIAPQHSYRDDSFGQYDEASEHEDLGDGEDGGGGMSGVLR